VKPRILSLAALLALSTTVAADVVYDANGVGSVGKGDILSVFGWNANDLQASAGLLQFRMMSVSTATWQCTGVNPAGVTVVSTHGAENTPVESEVLHQTLRNRNNVVTGFDLGGVATALTEYTAIGACPYNQNWRVYRTMVPGSLVYEGGGEPMLQVSIDGQTWYDLPVTE